MVVGSLPLHRRWLWAVLAVALACLRAPRARATLDDLYDADNLYGAEKRSVDERVKNGTGVIYFVRKYASIACTLRSLPSLTVRPASLASTPDVHKAGGTTICALAKANKMRIPPEAKSKGWMGKNCNPRKVDKPTAWEGTVAEQLRYQKRENINFLAIEMALPAQLAWGHFAMFGMVRDPVKLMISHCKWGGVRPNKCVEDWTERQIFVYVNRALGPERAGKPYTAQNLDQAKHRLRRFSLIVPLERLGEAGPLLRAHFGWQHTNATAFRTGTRGKSLALTKMTPEMLAKLRNQTRLDHQLYDYACMLFDQQTELLAKSPSGGGGGGSGGSPRGLPAPPELPAPPPGNSNWKRRKAAKEKEKEKEEEPPPEAAPEVPMVPDLGEGEDENEKAEKENPAAKPRGAAARRKQAQQQQQQADAEIADHSSSVNLD
jgi:hypothetical protein